MMLKWIYLALSLLAGLLTGALCYTGWARLWGLGIALLAFLGFLLLHLLYVVVTGFFLKPYEEKRTRSGFLWFVVEETCDLILFVCNVSAKVIGEEKLPKDGRFLFVCNHRSSLDPVAALTHLRGRNILFICKPAVFKIPAVGPYLRRCGFQTIDRENARNALVTIKGAAERLETGEYSIGVFPEGTRTKTGRLLPFHDGVFKIAQKANVPVVVAVVRGSEEIRRRAPLRHTKMEIEILRVIPAQEVKGLRSHELADRARAIMVEALPEEQEA